MKKTKFLLALVLVLTTAVFVGGGTYALFSASTETSSNDLTAGRLVINSKRDNGDIIPGPMFYVTAAQGQTPSGQNGTIPTGIWAPGDHVRRTLIIENDRYYISDGTLVQGSTLDAWLKSVRANLKSGDAALAKKLNVVISTDQEILNGGLKNNAEKIVAQGTLEQFLAGEIELKYPDNTKIPMYLPSVRNLHFDITFDRSADNTYQGKSLVVDFTVNTEQMTNNP